jgi:predicted ester cyclase
VFHAAAVVDSFLAAFPRYNTDEQLEKLKGQREALVAKINSRLQTGKFDLSRLPEQDRLPVARRYVEFSESCLSWISTSRIWNSQSDSEKVGRTNCWWAACTE